MMRTETIKEKMRAHGMSVDSAMDSDECEALDFMAGIIEQDEEDQ
jgi:hypothetical protein